MVRKVLGNCFIKFLDVNSLNSNIFIKMYINFENLKLNFSRILDSIKK